MTGLRKTKLKSHLPGFPETSGLSQRQQSDLAAVFELSVNSLLLRGYFPGHPVPPKTCSQPQKITVIQLCSFVTIKHTFPLLPPFHTLLARVRMFQIPSTSENTGVTFLCLALALGITFPMLTRVLAMISFFPVRL